MERGRRRARVLLRPGSTDFARLETGDSKHQVRLALHQRLLQSRLFNSAVIAAKKPVDSTWALYCRSAGGIFFRRSRNKAGKEEGVCILVTSLRNVQGCQLASLVAD